jgi:bifunctional non-homologous end joining protein LigD
MSLQVYRRKRDFARTPEPAPAKQPQRAQRRKAGPLQFVVQKHDATRLHYDLRLEMDGKLRSWAVPKGLPFAKGSKHLAVEVEDHPLEYGTFEGVIPAGEYGGGTVMLWDHGTYTVGESHESDSAAAQHAHQSGKIRFQLEGSKVRGEWLLVRSKLPASGDKTNWLLLPAKPGKPPAKSADQRSVTTGRTLSQIAAEADSVWSAGQPVKRSLESKKSIRSLPSPQQPAKNDLKLPAEDPAFISPMKAKLSERLPSGPGWSFEIKFDGIRGIALKDGKQVWLWSRNQQNLTAAYPEICDAIRRLPVESATLDGEIVAIDDAGRSSFQQLQQSKRSGDRERLCFYAFDLLQVVGRSLRGLPLSARRERLAKLLQEAEAPLLHSGDLPGDPEEIFAEISARGLEGLIAKRTDSRYESGRRSGAWLKIKADHQQEFVIGGWTAPKGARKHFGALLVGYREGRGWKYAGKVGTGFDARSLQELLAKLEPLARETSPFSDFAEPKGRKLSLSPADLRVTRWAEPKLVCQIRFTEWTEDGRLRHPTFLGLRDDKKPSEVRREDGFLK